MAASRPIRLPASWRGVSARKNTSRKRQLAARKATGLATPMTLEAGGVLRLVLPRALRSPNVTYYQSTWVKRADRLDWEGHLRAAIALASLSARSTGIANGHVPVRVTVERQVKTAAHFIPDEENWGFVVKPLYDALKNVGLIYDDSRRWVDRTLTETISLDGRARTVVTIARRPASQEPA